MVSEEAIKEIGYEYEDTEEFYYVMEYLRYVCPLLVQVALPSTPQSPFHVADR